MPMLDTALGPDLVLTISQVIDRCCGMALLGGAKEAVQSLSRLFGSLLREKVSGV
jgi:hypothetical protein